MKSKLLPPLQDLITRCARINEVTRWTRREGEKAKTSGFWRTLLLLVHRRRIPRPLSAAELKRISEASAGSGFALWAEGSTLQGRSFQPQRVIPPSARPFNYWEATTIRLPPSTNERRTRWSLRSIRCA